ncbi:MAG: ribosomal-processing cysteine protease Prp [Clostridia bacterium]|nr:ribosomal-processing cysteine protease Prp [Clostridia bacterium]
MINIHVVRDNEGFIWEFTVDGHAGFGAAGNDIVCSAVSALAYTAIGALEDVAGIKFDYSIEDSGYMRCSIPTDIPFHKKNEVGTILKTIVLGFKQIELSYGKYVAVLDEEV